MNGAVSSGPSPSTEGASGFVEDPLFGGSRHPSTGDLLRMATAVKASTSKVSTSKASDDGYFSMNHINIAARGLTFIDPVEQRRSEQHLLSTKESVVHPVRPHWDRPITTTVTVSVPAGVGDVQRQRQLDQQFQQEQLQSTAQDKRGLPPSKRPPLIPLLEVEKIPIGGVTSPEEWNRHHKLIYPLDCLPEWADPKDPPRRHTFGDNIAVHRILGLDEETDIRRVNSPICLHYARDGFFSQRNMFHPELSQEEREDARRQLVERYMATHDGRLPTRKMLMDFDDTKIDQDRREHEANCRERLASALKRKEVSATRKRSSNPLLPGDRLNTETTTPSAGCKCTTQ